MRHLIALGIVGVLLVALGGCGGRGSDAGSCQPEDLVWVYSRVVDRDSHAQPTRVFRLRHGAETALTSDGAASAPSVSPDGTRIAFARGSDGDPESAGYQRFRLYVMDSDGGGERPLLDPAHENPDPVGGIAWDTGPAWSPDGSRIAFVRNDDRTGTHHVMVVSPAATGPPQALPGSGTNLHDPTPAWSLDSARLAWTTASPDILHWSDVDGANIGRARLPGVGGTPAWDAAGDGIVVPVHADGKAPTLYHVDLTSRRLTKLDISLSGLWRLPIGQLAGVRPEGDRSTIVVLDADLAGEARAIATIDERFDDTREPVNAIPKRQAGWGAC